jgi:hypothetical protein
LSSAVGTGEFYVSFALRTSVSVERVCRWRGHRAELRPAAAGCPTAGSRRASAGSAGGAFPEERERLRKGEPVEAGRRRSNRPGRGEEESRCRSAARSEGRIPPAPARFLDPVMRAGRAWRAMLTSPLRTWRSKAYVETSWASQPSPYVRRAGGCSAADSSACPAGSKEALGARPEPYAHWAAQRATAARLPRSALRPR